MAINRHAADEEARAEVDVLTSRLEKTTQLTKKIQASLARLKTSGRSVENAIGPIYDNTQRLQVLGKNIDGVIGAIGKIRQPSDIKNNEEDIIRAGPESAGLSSYLASLNRINKALSELKSANLKSNQQAAADLGRLLKLGNQQLEAVFRRILQEDAAPVEPLAYITKEKPFPLLSQDKTTRLGLINSVVRQTQDTGQIYASVRGPYLLASLSNLAAASINTAKKKNTELYRQGTNGIESYAKGIEGAFVAEFDNICALFPRDEWRRVFTLACQTSMNELSKTLKELNQHIRANLTTDCFLGYEIIEIISNLSTRIETRTGELKSQFASALKPIRDTGRSSLAELLEDIRRRVGNLQSLPTDGALPITTEIVTRLQTMLDFLRPVSSIMISLGDGNWKNVNTAQSNDTIPSLKSFDISADGKDLFAHYSIDTIDTLLSSLDQKGRLLLKGKPVLGVFLANNLAVIQRMIRNSDLGPILSSRASGLDVWRKKASALYIDPWNDLSRILMEAQHITRSAPKGRPPSGSATDSATVVKGLSSKERDAIKEKFRQFNTTFDELVARHKTMPMEREVKEMFGKEVQVMVEPLYGRFWDRYHELDKGKGKYVKYDKAGISSICASLV